MARTRCDSCEALMIQGIFCHETGCPNTHSRYDVESGEWVKQRECRECGYTVDADDECCNGEFEADSASYYSAALDDCCEQIAMNGADNTETIADANEVSDND